MKDFSKLEEKLNIKFKNKNLLEQAFIHRSYLNEKPKLKLEDNERLEFLGDAVLELVVTAHLYKNYNNPEGELTTWRAALVNSENLAKISKKVDFGDFLLLSKGEAKDAGKARNIILANTLEAFLGALYLDLGYGEAEKFIAKNLLPELPQILKQELWRDDKSYFQELAQERFKITPVYKALKEWGPDHDKTFISGVYLKDKLIAQGKGASKHEAEQNAAKEALIIKNWN